MAGVDILGSDYDYKSEMFWVLKKEQTLYVYTWFIVSSIFFVPM